MEALLNALAELVNVITAVIIVGALLILYGGD